MATPGLLPLHTFSSDRLAIAHRTGNSRIFIEGPFGTGKTTIARERLRWLVDQGTDPQSILIWLPHRPLGEAYTLDQAGEEAGQPERVTLSSFAQNWIERYWGGAGVTAGFQNPQLPPNFLNHEAAQLVLSQLIEPLLRQGYFQSVRLDRGRLLSQILDGLNKAAGAGFPHTEIGARLRTAWQGASARLQIFEEVQDCANRFRDYCLSNNLLDYSLQIEVLAHNLWPLPEFRDHLRQTYRHLIIDNLEEDVAVAHSLLTSWIDDFDSVLAIYDTEAGYRTLLGADPESGYRLKDYFSETHIFEQSFTLTPGLTRWGLRLLEHLDPALASLPDFNRASTPVDEAEIRQAFTLQEVRYFPQILDWAAETAADLVNSEGVPSEEIVLLLPSISEAVTLGLIERLHQAGLPAHLMRPSRALKDEPITGALKTFSLLAHPEWGSAPPKPDVVQAFVQAISGLDPIRAQLLVDIVYRVRDGLGILTPYTSLRPEAQERITDELGERYEVIRTWIAEVAQDRFVSLEQFLLRIQAEVLTVKGYNFFENPRANQIVTNLVESVHNYLRVIQPALIEHPSSPDRTYWDFIEAGLSPGQYLRVWEPPEPGRILIAPVYTFVMANRAVDVQFWLDAGSPDWLERLYQPLTHPEVLSHSWPPGRPWTDLDEVQSNRERLTRICLGLIRRCRRRLYVGVSELGESGNEQRGPLLRAWQAAGRTRTAKNNRETTQYQENDSEDEMEY